jgi:hypothetical protein
MSSIVLLLALLLGVVGLMLAAGLAYAAHRRPALTGPLNAGLSGMTLMVAVVAIIVSR